MGKKVVHLIAGLGKGGAETMLYQVLQYGHREGQSVISFGESHYYEPLLAELGVAVTELPLRRRPISTLLRLTRLLRGTDTLCCWMYHASFFGFLAGKAAGVGRIVWCIRHSNLDPVLNSRMTLLLSRICARWSRNVDRIAYNGQKSRAVHEAAGYAPERGIVLDNGCDLDAYRPDPAAHAALLSELGLDGARQVVLSVTKDTPIKDIPTFLHAFGALRRSLDDPAAVLCGMGVVPENPRLRALCEEEGLTVGEDVFLLGLRHDVPRLLSGCDVYVLHSAGEAFPNVLLQAMACGCLCLTTDVGDARRILAQDDCVLAPGDCAALTEKMVWALSLPVEERERIGQENRRRANTNFDIHCIVQAYEALWGGSSSLTQPPSV